nr:hypothetical protein [Tanacetum cinerariifolium]
MEEKDDGFKEVKSRKKKKGANSRSRELRATTLSDEGINLAKIMELRNDECVEGAAVTIPLAAIEEGNVGKKPLYQFRNDPNFRPKVLVRGSGSNNNVNRVSDETINIKNSFNVLSNDGDDTDDMGGINVNDEFESKVWHELKEEVDILMEA